MPSKKSSPVASKKSSQQKKGEEVVMWVRLPRPMKAEELRKRGLDGAACFGGDTCIAATTMRSDVGIVVQTELAEVLEKAKLTRRADPCFGGDTCIV
jgi:hypothetical protein